jgi:hypothetical protein
MTLRHGVLCLLALVIIVLLAFENYETWTAPVEPVSLKGGAKKTSVKPEGSKPPADQKDSNARPSSASYIFIAEKNPFHPDRKEFTIPEVPKAEVKKPIVRPQVTLYGITIVGDYQSATLSYPGRPLQKGERETITVRIGDQVGEYKVSQILQDRIALKTEGDSFEVNLYNAKKRTSVKTENKPAAVVSTGLGTGGATPEGARPVPGSLGVPGAPIVTTPPPGTTPAPAPSKPAVTPPASVQAPGVTPSAPIQPPAGGIGAPSSRTRRFQPTTPGGQ